MYTAVIKLLSNNTEQVLTRKFLSRQRAVKWAEKMWRKHPICVAQVNGKGFYTCII